MLLPINLNDLLGAKTVESNRIEFKQGWNPDAIYKTICAFANDFDNGGGGYIVVGVVEERGRAKRPVLGLTTDELARIQRDMIGYNNLIRPVLHPRLFIEEADGQQILVIWVPGSASRPHEVPEVITASKKVFQYYIRQYANSVKANQAQQQELITMTNAVPFDDRPNTTATLNDISILWVREYLRVSRARLNEQAETLTKADLLDQMELLAGPPEYRFPRNVALMLFCEYPEKFFPYTYIELVDFQRADGEKAFTEYTFRGPVQSQIKQLIAQLRTLVLTEMVIKVVYQPEALRPWSYPPRAVEEAIANCIYHRNYQQHDPVRVFLHADRLIFQNGGGPDRAIRPEDFDAGRVQPRHYRNRRLGSFLKALDLTEGFATGIRLMLDELAANGSAPPVFSMDDERTYFAVEFALHPAFVGYQQPILPPVVPGALKHLISGLSVKSLTIMRTMPTHPIGRRAVLALAGLSNESRNASRYIEPLLAINALTLTITDRPRSPRQQYDLTTTGRDIQQFLQETDAESLSPSPS